MDKVKLGKTGLNVSVLGLGCGGYSRLGISKGLSEENAVRVVRRTIDLGINLIDTAEGYGTEHLVGAGIRGVPRDSLVLCTKTDCGSIEKPKPAHEVALSIEGSLRRLGTDFIDIYQMHGVTAQMYPYVTATIVPVLQKAREQGKIRFLGITEGFETDTSHEMHRLSSIDNCWDTLLVGFNILNTSARKTVFPNAKKNGMGILDMFAVRHALINQVNLKPVLQRLIDNNRISASEIDMDNPLGFLLEEASTLSEAAYRFCRHDPDVHVVISGTGSAEHIEANVAAMEKPPLSAQALKRLQRIFGDIDCESGRRQSN
jgi:L-galactose dehydrogenase